MSRRLASLMTGLEISRSENGVKIALSPLSPLPVPPESLFFDILEAAKMNGQQVSGTGPDLTERMRAYAGVEPDELPAFWTPEHVCVRMVEAMEMTHRVGSRTGPAKIKSFWPASMQEAPPLKDLAAWLRISEDYRQKTIREPVPPSALESSRANEALGWPLKYLGNEPLQADALTLWAWCTAREALGGRVGGGGHQARILRARAKIALPVAEAIMKAENIERGKLHCQIVRGVCEWANSRLASAKDEAQRAAIKANAVIRLERELAKRQSEWKPAPLKMGLGLPGRVVTPMALAFHRKKAAAVICAALNRGLVLVR